MNWILNKLNSIKEINFYEIYKSKPLHFKFLSIGKFSFDRNPINSNLNNFKLIPLKVILSDEDITDIRLKELINLYYLRNRVLKISNESILDVYTRELSTEGKWKYSSFSSTNDIIDAELSSQSENIFFTENIEISNYGKYNNIDKNRIKKFNEDFVLEFKVNIYEVSLTMYKEKNSSLELNSSNFEIILIKDGKVLNAESKAFNKFNIKDNNEVLFIICEKKDKYLTEVLKIFLKKESTSTKEIKTTKSSIKNAPLSGEGTQTQTITNKIINKVEYKLLIKDLKNNEEVIVFCSNDQNIYLKHSENIDLITDTYSTDNPNNSIFIDRNSLFDDIYEYIKVYISSVDKANKLEIEIDQTNIQKEINEWYQKDDRISFKLERLDNVL